MNGHLAGLVLLAPPQPARTAPTHRSSGGTQELRGHTHAPLVALSDNWKETIMTNTNKLVELLGEPRTAIISAWDIVITPSLALSLAQTKTKLPECRTEDLVHAVITDDASAYAIGGYATLQANLEADEERFIKVAAYDDPYEDTLDHPCWLERALEGRRRPRYAADPFIWQYMTNFEASDWEIAERVAEPLRLVKQVRKVKQGLAKRNIKAPTSWQAALQLAAEEVPNVFTRSLARTLKQQN